MARLIGTVSSGRRRAPDAPTIGTATDVGTSRAYNDGAATVTFTAPSYDGGLPVTSYTVTSSPGGFTASGASSPLTVTGLASNTSYTFTVTATNAAGTSATSSASNSITATTVPQAPTIGTATGGNTSASITFTAGATGGKAVSTFTATSSPSSITGTSASSPISVTGLSNGTAYTFTITATNANGTSSASAASNSVTPAVPDGWYQIASTTWTSGNITFSSIPSTYKALVLRFSAGDGTGGTYYPTTQFYFNNTTVSAGYDWAAIRYQNNATGINYNESNLINIVGGIPGNQVSRYKGDVEIMLFNYANSSYFKPGLVRGGMFPTGATNQFGQTIFSYSRADTGSINQIDITPQAGFKTGNIFALYGLAGA